MTEAELKKNFPNASKSFFTSNTGHPEKLTAVPWRAEGVTSEQLDEIYKEPERKTPAVRPDFLTSLKPCTDEQKLNKLEKKWLHVLRSQNHPCLEIQAITLKLADDTRYTPDFSAIGPNGEMIFWETKGGFMREDSFLKLKFAARKFRWARFILVTREKGEWKEKEIKP